MNNKLIIILAIILLICYIITVHAESDPTGDVYYFNGPDANILWQHYGTKDHIDITDASFSKSGSDITISLTVSDSIANDQKIKYYFLLKTNPTSFYQFDYTNKDSIATGNGDLSGYVDTNPKYTISSDGKTISYTFTDIDASLDYTIKAYAVEFLTFGVTYGEAWYDYAPECQAPYSSEVNGNDGKGFSQSSNGTPGFEFFALIIAFAAIVFILEKRI